MVDMPLKPNQTKLNKERFLYFGRQTETISKIQNQAKSVLKWRSLLLLSRVVPSITLTTNTTMTGAAVRSSSCNYNLLFSYLPNLSKTDRLTLSHCLLTPLDWMFVSHLSNSKNTVGTIILVQGLDMAGCVIGLDLSNRVSCSFRATVECCRSRDYFTLTR